MRLRAADGRTEPNLDDVGEALQMVGAFSAVILAQYLREAKLDSTQEAAAVEEKSEADSSGVDSDSGSETEAG